MSTYICFALHCLQKAIALDEKTGKLYCGKCYIEELTQS